MPDEPDCFGERFTMTVQPFARIVVSVDDRVVYEGDDLEKAYALRAEWERLMFARADA